MKAVQVECDNCGALLNVDEGLQWVTCEYCHTKSRLQAPMAKPAAAPPQQPAVAQPAAHSPSSVSPKVALIPLIAVAAAGGIAYFVIGGGGLGSRTQWEGVGRALLVDLNGDSVADPIGRTRRVGSADRVNLAAFDGKTGELLWEGDRLGTYIESYQGKLSLAGSSVVYGSSQGDVRAFSTKDGKQLWQVPVGEKVKTFCQAPKGIVGVLTIDKKLQFLNLSDGTKAPDQGQGCKALDHDRRDGDQQRQRLRGFRRKIAGMGSGDSYQHVDGGPIVVAGYAKPGTRVPKVAVFEDEGLLWKSEVPGNDRMGARAGRPEKIAFDKDHLVAVYKTNKFNSPPKVALFRMKDGRRLWETTLPSAMPVTSAQLSSHLVLVSSWGRLTAFDPNSGKQLYSIGYSMK